MNDLFFGYVLIGGGKDQCDGYFFVIIEVA